MKRALRLERYVPDRIETLKLASGTWSDTDIGKAVKYDGDNVDLCASGDEIVGFLAGVEPYTKDGDKVCSVTMDINTEAYGRDEAGNLTVGDIVKAGTAVAVGTALTATTGGSQLYTAQNVLVEADPSAYLHRWQVVAVAEAATAGTLVLLRKV